IIYYDVIIKKNKIVEFIFLKILALPVLILFGFRYIMAPVLSFPMFLFVYLIPSTLFLSFNDFNPIFNQYRLGIVYLLSLFSILIFAYQSTFIMRYMID